jgi:hypothetical protein
MIGFGVCVGNQATFERYAAPSFERVREHDSVLVTTTADGSIHSAYNGLLDRFAARDDLEALVLLHEDVELTDPGFCARVRALLGSDEQIAVLGTVGARGVHSLAWWQGEVVGHVVEPRGEAGTLGSGGEVEALDGMLLVLSPWAVRNVRFDEGYRGFHAYDVDYCFSVRAAGRKAFATALGVVHHTKGGVGDTIAWNVAAARARKKWGLGPARRRPEPLALPASEHAASLLIVLGDDLDAAQRCLLSVTELADDQPDHDVVIVADEQARTLAPLLDQLAGEVTLVRGAFPPGRLDRVINAGVERCRGDVVALLRGMPVVTPGFLRPLHAALQSNVVVAAASVATDRPGSDPREALVLAARRSDLVHVGPRLNPDDRFAALCRALELHGDLTVTRSSVIRAGAGSGAVGAPDALAPAATAA